MIFSELFAVATALLMPAAFAAPTLGAPSNSQAPAYGLSPLVAQALTLSTADKLSAFTAGRCTFHAQVQQQCVDGKTKTSVSIGSVLDSKGKAIVKPANGLPVAVDLGVWRVKGFGEDLTVYLKDEVVNYTYGNRGDPVVCKTGDWTIDALACDTDNNASRIQDMDCSFPWIPSKPKDEYTTIPINRRGSLNLLKLTDTDVTPITSDALSPSYAHGYCSFKMRLLNQCLFNPDENWHNEMFGNLYSIEDNDRQTAVRYPDGAGRIDGKIKRLTGMGNGLYLTYYQDGKVYFRFDNSQWDTSTPDDGKANGLCHWGAWSRDPLACKAENGGQSRLSDIACVFRC